MDQPKLICTENVYEQKRCLYETRTAPFTIQAGNGPLLSHILYIVKYTVAAAITLKNKPILHKYPFIT
jgi:hypothetical protein